MANTRSTDGGDTELATALAYRCLSAGFRYPDANNLDALGELGRGLGAAVSLVAVDGDPALGEAFRESQDRLENRSAEELEASYVSLFGHSAHGPCPPYETEYGQSQERLQQPHEIADLGALYRAFGLEIEPGLGERPDFVSVECEFAAFLCAKRAWALDQDDAELAAIALDARRRLLRDHLGRWVPSFAGLLQRETQEGFYPALARFAVALVEADAARAGVLPARTTLRVRLPGEPPEAAMQCPRSSGTPPSLEV